MCFPDHFVDLSNFVTFVCNKQIKINIAKEISRRKVDFHERNNGDCGMVVSGQCLWSFFLVSETHVSGLYFNLENAYRFEQEATTKVGFLALVLVCWTPAVSG